MDRKLYKMMDWARVEQIVYSEEDNPHEYLGAHPVKGGWMVSCFIPGAQKCELVTPSKEYKMDRMDEEGFFSVFVRSLTKTKLSYKFKVTKDKSTYIIEDPYRFRSIFTAQILRSFSAGICYDIYEYLGAHVRKSDGVKGVNFAVWAPNAVRVSVVGDFNNWDGRVHQMRRLGDSGIFEIFIPRVMPGDNYKYELKLKGGMISLKADPYGYFAQLRPETASTVYDIDSYKWGDDEFVKNRAAFNAKDKPFLVYEIHLGSFAKPDDGREFLSYAELADAIIPYVKKMGYTHIELMPVMEHPFDESWGYQVIGMFAPTSRFGTPDEFMNFVDRMHDNGIGVILDWVPSHFPKDVQGLSNFDGTCLYEHQDPRRAEHPDWGTLCFNYGRSEVSNYLISNALFWIRKYHADGIRMDAVASMLYLDYGKRGGDWLPNIYGGNENLEAEEMLRHLNSINKKMNTGALMIAEESTAWPHVTGELEGDGLGFDYKWNMGWMNDFLGFIRLDPLYRSGHYSELTFSMIYAYSERFILVFSHDEVVHGKAALLAKMPGERDRKFANLRASLGYMFTHPGKKLLFMGSDIGEWDEWNEKRSIGWDLLQYDDHIRYNDYVRALTELYKTTPALYSLDNDIDGFEWINNVSANETIIVFVRKDAEGNSILVVCNFADIDRSDYKIGVPFSGKYKEIFSSDETRFGGRGFVNPRVKRSKADECDGREYSIRINVAALSVSVFSCTYYEACDLKYYHAPVKKRRKRKR